LIEDVGHDDWQIYDLKDCCNIQNCEYTHTYPTTQVTKIKKNIPLIENLVERYRRIWELISGLIFDDVDNDDDEFEWE